VGGNSAVVRKDERGRSRGWFCDPPVNLPKKAGERAGRKSTEGEARCERDELKRLGGRGVINRIILKRVDVEKRIVEEKKSEKGLKVQEKQGSARTGGGGLSSSNTLTTPSPLKKMGVWGVEPRTKGSTQ